jgi:hypothetical protein
MRKTLCQVIIGKSQKQVFPDPDKTSPENTRQHRQDKTYSLQWYTLDNRHKDKDNRSIKSGKSLRLMVHICLVSEVGGSLLRF